MVKSGKFDTIVLMSKFVQIQVVPAEVGIEEVGGLVEAALIGKRAFQIAEIDDLIRLQAELKERVDTFDLMTTPSIDDQVSEFMESESSMSTAGCIDFIESGAQTDLRASRAESLSIAIEERLHRKNSQFLNDDALRELFLLEGLVIDVRSTNEEYPGEVAIFGKDADQLYRGKRAALAQIGISAPGAVSLKDMTDASEVHEVLFFGDQASVSMSRMFTSGYGSIDTYTEPVALGNSEVLARWQLFNCGKNNQELFTSFTATGPHADRKRYTGSVPLILDEPTAAVDANAEYEIFENIKKTQGEKTSIIISHRFSTVRNADTIYVVQDGSIVEQGDHTSLMKNKKLYSEMFSKQAKGYK